MVVCVLLIQCFYCRWCVGLFMWCCLCQQVDNLDGVRSYLCFVLLLVGIGLDFELGCWCMLLCKVVCLNVGYGFLV